MPQHVDHPREMGSSLTGADIFPPHDPSLFLALALSMTFPQVLLSQPLSASHCRFRPQGAWLQTTQKRFQGNIGGIKSPASSRSMASSLTYLYYTPQKSREGNRCQKTPALDDLGCAQAVNLSYGTYGTKSHAMDHMAYIGPPPPSSDPRRLHRSPHDKFSSFILALRLSTNNTRACTITSAYSLLLHSPPEPKFGSNATFAVRFPTIWRVPEGG